MTASTQRMTATTLPTALRWIVAMMAAQLFVAVRCYTTPDAFSDPALNWTFPLRNRQTIFGALLLGALIGLVMVRPRLGRHWQAFLDSTAQPRGALPLIAQISACTACYALAWPLYAHPAQIGDLGWPLLIAWAASVMACGAASLWLLAPLRYWRTLLAGETQAFAVAAIGVIGSGALIALVYRAWQTVPLLAHLTLNSSAWLLRPLYPAMTVDTRTAIIEAEGFRVQISDVCSGYLGVSLTLGFLACYCYLFRAEIRPWLMAALLPFGIALSLALNAVRIAALVILGVEISPEVAAKGFHTNAGSIAMLLCCAIVVALAHRLFVARATADDSPRLGWTLDFESALLIPFMALLAVTLLTGAFSGDFVWLYPARVLAVGLVLALCWKPLRALAVWPSILPVAVGAAVYAMWIAMIDADAAASAAFASALGTAAPAAAIGWLLLRTLGAVVTVPIAEELAFRGYLLAVLSRQPVKPDTRLRFDGLGLIGSSLLFGALHGQWLAGTLAGLAYGGLRYRRDRIGDAVVAHMTTNLLLAIHVFATGHWSYW
ncbi:exosortase E/protease, VPEID-CTERM system [Nevskia sp.]|uniref:exosortase E/protease, VPEID-CTERM system n=1 Tax=Nevskia sp. TaxID=1929292 RepID=UPI0025E55876|nr:exosortase E/protease, VPEID-CTERM system [Nevskia sp.]